MEPKDLLVLRQPSAGRLKRRSVGELRVETAQLQKEHRAMEQRLQELRAAMSREKEERKKLGAFRWKSARAESVTGTSRGYTDSKENNAHKLPSGRVRVRLLKQELPEEPRRALAKPPRPPLVPGNVASGRKSRLSGKPCGQCETRAAGVMCVECGEDYCVGCFARFHQKGALKHHRMIPMKMEIHTSISTLDILGRFRRQIDDDETSAPLWEGGTMRSTAPSQAPVCIQSAGVSAQEGEEGVWQEECGHLGGQRATLLSGEFDEEESARSFREALESWRQGGERPCVHEEVMPAVNTECAATQADLTLRRLAVQVEFQEYGLSYMERLLVKKHRRSPVEQHRPSLHSTCLTDDECPALTAEEMEMKRYCTSLFSAPATGDHSQREGATQRSPSFEETVDGDIAGGPKPTTSSAVDWGAQSKDARESQVLDAASPIIVDSRDPPSPSQTRVTNSPELDLSFRVQSPETSLSSKTSVTQTPEPDMSSSSPVSQSPEGALSSRTLLTQFPEPDLSFSAQVAQSSEVARFSVTRMNHSPPPDLSFETSVTQSAEVSLLPWTQMARLPELDLVSGCATLQSPRVGLISAKFPCPGPPVTAPCGPSQSPRLPPQLRSALALRSSFSAGESSVVPGALLSGSLCPGGAGERSPEPVHTTSDPTSSPVLGHCLDLPCELDLEAGARMSGEPSEPPNSSEALCSLNRGELTWPHWNLGLVPITGLGAIAEPPCGPMNPAAGTGSGWQLMDKDDLHTSQPRPTSFCPPVPLPLYPGPPSQSFSLSLSPSLPNSPSVSSSLSPPPSRAFISLRSPSTSPLITPPLSLSALRPCSPPMTPPLSQEFGGVDPAPSSEPFLEEDAERLTLARLEEELRRMSAETPSLSLGQCADVTSRDQGIWPPSQRMPYIRRGSARVEESEEEEEQRCRV